MRAQTTVAPACQLAFRTLQLARDGIPADVGAAQVGRHAHLAQRECAAAAYRRSRVSARTSSTEKPLPCMKREARAPEFIAVDSARLMAAATAVVADA